MLDVVNSESPMVFKDVQRLPPQNWIQENHRVKHPIFNEVIADHVSALSHRGESFLIGWTKSLKNCA